MRALRVSFECGWLGPACARSFAGSKEEVLAAVIAHQRRDHDDGRSDGELEDAIGPLIREEAIGWVWSGGLSAFDVDRPA